MAREVRNELRDKPKCKLLPIFTSLEVEFAGGEKRRERERKRKVGARGIATEKPE
jgi:hypothetical protein